MKFDFGVLILGMMFVSYYKVFELLKVLFNFKELFLVCFFLNIGFFVYLIIIGIMFVLLFLLLLLIKGVLYFWVIY